ncbi:TPA: glutamyl-tRNA amidotransferase [Candidatus Taylorbacteria bacterium]|nr:glutamyl-tRNA amidotransferase [Candidatus Taylorbacteria bacterium]
MLQKQIKDSIKEAMLARDSIKLITLRGLANSMTNELIAQKRSLSEELSDEDVIKVLQRLAKQRKDAIEQFAKAERPELVASETAELHIIEAYLPQMMNKDEIRKIAEAKKAELGVTDKAGLGKFMAVLMKDLKGKANGTDVKEVAESLF